MAILTAGPFVPSNYLKRPRDLGAVGTSDRAGKDVPVIDRGKQDVTATSGQTFNVQLAFRRTDSDRKPPREVVTRKLLGDPAPGRTPWAAP